MSNYSDKLKDPRWQKKRLEIFERDNWTCQKCNDKKSPLAIHHKVYFKGCNPWDYPADVLITLCVSCHDKETYLQKGINLFKQSCDNCYHQIEAHCACREITDMLVLPKVCPDWYPKDNSVYGIEATR